ncbi:MAG TPA: protein phosphatase 2C domain-containing protein [bacterium]|nr:protein phosphatase 2C domain-containing protein [bacterium]
MRLHKGPVHPPPVTLEVGAATDPGNVRPKNEDYHRYEIPEDPAWLGGRGCLFLVADGVGGSGGGAVASAEAAHAVTQEYYLGLGGDPGRALRRAVERANLHICHLRAGHPGLAGMQTTLTALVLCAGRYWIGHVGDSKAFLLRGGSLRQLTRDHTVLQEMRRLGLVSPKRATRHPHRHLLTRTVGGDLLVAVDLQRGEARPGDCFVLSTDGLFEHLEPEEVRTAFTDSPAAAAAAACVEEAKRRGGFDNLTVLAARIPS